MSERFVVEADRQVVGVAVRFAGGFKFFASDSAYLSLEGRAYSRAKALAQSVAKIARSERRRRRTAAPLTPSLQ